MVQNSVELCSLLQLALFNVLATLSVLWNISAFTFLFLFSDALSHSDISDGSKGIWPGVLAYYT